MANYIGNIPEAPDIRQQRPSYFAGQNQVNFPTEFAMPSDMQRFDPMANQWQNQVPDMWPEIEQQLRGILEQGPGQYYTPPPGGTLTPEQEQHNKMLMAWKSPSGLSAIETGKYRELQQREANLDRAEKRIANIEKQILAASKVEGVPKGLVAQLEKRLNSSITAYDTMLKNAGQPESGYPKYTGEGKFELEGMEKKPGILARMGEFLRGLGGGEGENVPPPTPSGFESPESVAQSPADVAPQKSNLMLRGLLEADRLLAQYLGNEKAKQVTDQIVASTKDPNVRLQKALDAIEQVAPKAPGVQALRQQTLAQRVAAAPVTEPQRMPTPEPGPSLPILERYMRGRPTQAEHRKRMIEKTGY